MRLWFTLLMVGCAARVPEFPPASEVEVDRSLLPAGERLVVQMDEELRTGHAKAGDRFTARVVTKLAALPPDARVAGSVVAAHRGSDESEPILQVKFDTLERGGCNAPLSARVTSAELETVERRPGDAYRSGAIVGGIMGGLLLRNPGLVTGFGLGLAGGSLHEMGAGYENAWLPKGALVQLQLQAPLDLHGACPI